MLIRRHARRAETDAAEAQWRTEVSTQLAALQARRAVTDMAEAQWRTEVSIQLAALQAGLETLQTKDQKQRRGPARLWMLAILVLCSSGVLVIIGIRMGLAAPAATAAASRLQAQITSIDNQIVRAPHAKADLAAAAKCNRLTDDLAVLECVANADPAIANNMQTLFNDEAEVQGEHFYADQLVLAGPAVLAFGSALSGAVLGWMLTECFAKLSRRRVGEPGNPEWNLEPGNPEWNLEPENPEWNLEPENPEWNLL
jgi:hypothetical protein